MGVEVKGMEATIKRLRRTGDHTNANALSAMKDGVSKITERAKQYAPVDSGDLEDAIKAVPTREGTFRRRYEWDIGVDKNATKTRTHMEDYHVEMHENYPAEYSKKSKKSSDKNDALKGQLSGKITLDRGKIVGGKYLERALKDYEDEIREEIEKIMREAGR